SARVEVARRGDPDAKIASGLREGIAAELAAPPAPPVTPVTHDAPVDEPPRPAEPRRPRESRAEPLPLELSMAAGLLMRGGGSDPLLQLRADVGSGLCVRGQTELSFSSEPEGLSVLEPSLQGGVAWCERGQHHAQLSVGLVAGVRLHHYDYEGDGGNRLGWQAALPVDVALVVEPVVLRFGAEVGVSHPTIEHEVLGVPTWRRSATFAALLVGVGVRP
ncbi:MAG TPA: hypothetical protein VM686_37420, partial [Polyangiaceae bacterium]|nr:hypothetical protein [Polyangiaceae bacterium]